MKPVSVILKELTYDMEILWLNSTSILEQHRNIYNSYITAVNMKVVR